MRSEDAMSSTSPDPREPSRLVVFLRETWDELLSAPFAAKAGMLCTLLYALIVILAPVLAPHWESEVFPQAFAPWSEEHVLGTDNLGRDMLSRLLYGTRNTVLISLAATLIAFSMGASLGMFAALAPKWFDQTLSRLVDILMAIPSLIFALMLLSVFGSGLLNIVLIIAALDATRVYRLTRAVAMNIAVMDFVEVARLRGEHKAWIAWNEILPNIFPYLLAEFGFRFCFVFLTISSLSFLGVGIQPPTADLGSMVRDTASLITYGDISPLLPAGMIAILTIAVNFVVDWALNKTSGLYNEQ